MSNKDPNVEVRCGLYGDLVARRPAHNLTVLDLNRRTPEDWAAEARASAYLEGMSRPSPMLTLAYAQLGLVLGMAAYLLFLYLKTR